MRVARGYPNGKILGQPVIDSEGHPTGGEIVTFSIPIATDVDKVASTTDPHAPSVLRRKRQHILAGLYHCFAIFAFGHCPGGIGNTQRRAKASRSVSYLSEPIL